MTGKRKNCSTKTNRFKERRGKTGKMIGFGIKAGGTQPRNSKKTLENMNKLPQQKTHDQKVARLKQARERLHRS